ncbi:hypothetical protein EI534_30805, partial [Pseudomonas frederiksbergensis]|nr:hypothetical protein [Pseudomonas frederiksbergensis]
MLGVQVQQPAGGFRVLVFAPQAGPALAGQLYLAGVAGLAGEHIQQVDIVRGLALLLGDQGKEAG